MAERPQRKHTRVLREWLPRDGTRLADLGCGGGALARVLAREGAWVVGIDPQPALLAKARRADVAGFLGAAVYVAAKGEALPLADAAVDAALYFNALHHVPEPQMRAALDEAARIIRRGGRLVVVEPIAEGPIQALTAPVDDETAVRAAADRAIRDAVAAGQWIREHESEYAAPVRYESFEAFRDELLRVDPARAPALRAHEAEMAERFRRDARMAEGAYWLDQPCRLHVLRPV